MYLLLFEDTTGNEASATTTTTTATTTTTTTTTPTTTITTQKMTSVGNQKLSNKATNKIVEITTTEPFMEIPVFYHSYFFHVYVHVLGMIFSRNLFRTSERMNVARMHEIFFLQLSTVRVQHTALM